MKRILTALSVVLCALLVSGGLPHASAQQAGGKPRIEDTRVERAPIDKKGGLMNPVAWCPGYSDPRVRTVVEGIDNNFRRVWKYRGSLPGLYFPRVKVGRYQLTTKAWCGQKTARRVEKVRVKEKTKQTTMSWREYQRIEKGMTPKRVQRITGSRGSSNHRYGNELMRTYDLMPFWQYGSVVFRNGHVVSKSWKFGHD